jgi:hypothetical protein
MDARLRLNVGGDVDQLGRISSRIGEESLRLPEEFLRVLREVADVLSTQAAAQVLLEPTYGPKHTGLRAAVSYGVGVTETADGVVVNTSMPQRDEAIIPRGLDDGSRGWRHPVFGHRDRWVVQRGTFSWFTDSMNEAEPMAREGLVNALQAAADRIAR